MYTEFYLFNLNRETSKVKIIQKTHTFIAFINILFRLKGFDKFWVQFT